MKRPICYYCQKRILKGRFVYVVKSHQFGELLLCYFHLCRDRRFEKEAGREISFTKERATK